MLRKLLMFVGALIAVLGLYLCLWPVPIEPVVWTPPPAPGYQGPHAQNQRLAGLKLVPLGDYTGPEDVAVAPDGAVVTAVEEGPILRLRPSPAESDGWSVETVADTGGRPLGLAYPPPGAALPAGWSGEDLFVADAFLGLLRVDPAGKIEVLADEAAGRPIVYADGVILDRRGRIYFTDASTRFGAKAYGSTFVASVLDILEHSGSGRVLMHDPHTGATRELITGLQFPNGVALSADERALLIAETGAYRVLRYPLVETGAAVTAGEAEVVLDNLPGYPDNVRQGGDGRYWVGLTRPRSALLDGVAESSFLRKLIVRLPEAIKPIPPSYGHVFAFDEHGRVSIDLQDPAGTYPSATGATETPTRLFIQSLHAHGGLGYLDRAQVSGLAALR
ncbi:SMP-30/gluconolactonase/LRE family protein [Haliangium sp.]|uniref:SMP-30/gluconolactonase/LRE family protein n=1 Tax=Haliangium sp. TaxID=2663208 RepID=UPI003D12F527